MRKFYGEFNRNGYTIYEQGVHDSDPEYQAGNCRFDSAQTLPVGAEGTLDACELEELCESTGIEIANENSGEWLGCSRIDDYDIEY
jgi:hypothetical protein